MTDTTTPKVLAHAKQVCLAVLGPDVSTAVSVCVYTAVETLPTNIQATHEYMIEIDLSSVLKIMPDALHRFGSFLGKKIIVQEVNPSTCLYWGEGDPLEHALAAPSLALVSATIEGTESHSPYESIEWMKTDTILPNWLDRVLFDTLGARNEPDWQRFDYNLNLDKEELKIYLGTYFTRSYAEAFCIIDALFENEAYAAVWKDKSEISLLDVGTGTGGNLIGILTALNKHCSQLTKVTVHGFDGNKLALDVAATVINSFASRASYNVNLVLEERRITSLDDLPTPALGSYDFITTFKAGGEIISKGGGKSDDFYYCFLKTYAEFLSDFGLFLLLDVTIKPEHTDFLPQLLNKDVSRFVQEHGGLCTVSPVPCYIYEAGCSESCFTQMEFSITHRSASKSKSRVAYRVLAQNLCAQIFHKNTEMAAEYVICAKPAKATFSICKHSSGCGRPLDGYRINKLTDVDNQGR